MDRTINVTVNGEFVRKDSKNAGVQGEGNVTFLHIQLSAEWESFSKRIVWRNALGENPTAILLFNPVSDLLEGKDPLIFDTYIPSEPLAVPGWCSFTIEGFRDSDPSAVTITLTDYLAVKPNDAYNAPAEPTPTQAQQLQLQIDGIVPQVTESVQAAISALNQAEEDIKVWEIWSSATKYMPLQKVSRLGSSYICTAACIGVDPVLDAGDGVQGVCWQLIAAKGDRGEQGPAGPQGNNGPAGAVGAPGVAGPQGERGEQGIQGLRGERGERGVQGEIGPVGPQGSIGLQGLQGIQGEQGKQGDTGPRGPQGIQGPQGAIGLTGPQGMEGPTGPAGPRGPEGPRGIDGVAVATSGMVAFNVTADGILQCSYTGNEQPNYYINAEGHLCLDM